MFLQHQDLPTLGGGERGESKKAHRAVQSHCFNIFSPAFRLKTYGTWNHIQEVKK